MNLASCRWVLFAFQILAVAVIGCVKYSNQEPNCQDKACQATCATDSDCPASHVCVFYEDGCCSRCDPIACQTDADCPEGAHCLVYENGCCSMCLPGGDEVLLVPACVHAPGWSRPAATFRWPSSDRSAAPSSTGSRWPWTVSTSRCV